MHRYVKKVTLQEVDEEGNISYGWKLIDSKKMYMEKNTVVQPKKVIKVPTSLRKMNLHIPLLSSIRRSVLKDKYANNEISEVGTSYMTC